MYTRAHYVYVKICMSAAKLYVKILHVPSRYRQDIKPQKLHYLIMNLAGPLYVMYVIHNIVKKTAL